MTCRDAKSHFSKSPGSGIRFSDVIIARIQKTFGIIVREDGNTQNRVCRFVDFELREPQIPRNVSSKITHCRLVIVYS